MMGVSRRIKAKIDYSDLSHNDFAQFVEGLYGNLSVSRHFPKLPVPLPVLRTKLDEYQGLITAAMDSKSARLKRNSVREELAKMVVQEAHYVEAVADGDVDIFTASGLKAIPTHRNPPQHLQRVGIKKVAHAANSGGANVTLTPSYRKVKTYQVRVRKADADTSEDAWRIETFVSANGPVTIAGLNPGTKYEFQARGYGILGWTDWSDSKLFICT
jgi:hypothetical protein